MSQPETSERILDAAGALFAERGYAETSLRTVTGAANVNLAAVNYHFGSKKGLIQAVFARFLDPFSERLAVELEKLEAEAAKGLVPDSQTLLRALFGALASTSRERQQPLSQIMRLIGQAYTQSQEHLRQFVMGRYGALYVRFNALLRQAVPDVALEAFYWRLYFMLGASVFTLSSYDSISSILKTDFDTDSSVETVVELLIPAAAAMLNNPDN